MKIGFTGTGGTGKTTTAKLLEKRLGLALQPSVVRGIFESKQLTERSLLSMSQVEAWSLQQEIFAAKLKQDKETFRGIFDRTLIDHMAYCFYRSGSVIPDGVVNGLLKEMNESLKLYDFLFYFPITFTPPPDGFRQEGLAYRHTVDWMIRGLLHRSCAKYSIIGGGSPEERAQVVADIIDDRSIPV